MNNAAPPKEEIKELIIEKLRQCYDPEIPVNIYDLGLIYDVDVGVDGISVAINMTLTSPACPVAGSLPLEVEAAAKTVSGIETAVVSLVWEPQWTPEQMSESARLELGFD